MREVSLPSTTAIPPPASIRFSSKSIAHSTWTSVAWSERTHLRESRRTLRRSPTGSTRSPYRNCIPIGRLPNRARFISWLRLNRQERSSKKKGHQHRQRPKSREETPTTGNGNEGVAAPQQMPPHCTKLNSQMTEAAMRVPQGFRRALPTLGPRASRPPLACPHLPLLVRARRPRSQGREDGNMPQNEKK